MWLYIHVYFLAVSPWLAATLLFRPVIDRSALLLLIADTHVALSLSRLRATRPFRDSASLLTEDLSSECIPIGYPRSVHAYYYALGLFRGYNVVERNNRL